LAIAGIFIGKLKAILTHILKV